MPDESIRWELAAEVHSTPRYRLTWRNIGEDFDREFMPLTWDTVHAAWEGLFRRLRHAGRPISSLTKVEITPIHSKE